MLETFTELENIIEIQNKLINKMFLLLCQYAGQEEAERIINERTNI